MNYPLTPLGNVASLQAGYGFPVELQGRKNGRYPFAKVGDISRCGRSESPILLSADHFVDAEDLVKLKAKLVPPGSVVFAKIGEAIRQNHRVIAGCEMLIDNNAMAAIPNELIEGHFLYHYLKTVDFYALAPATTVPALRKSDLEKIQVPLPPRAEQRRIAAILDQADALRAKRREALAQLDSLTQSIFIEMFGDLSLNPNCFPVRKLGDICDVRDGTHDSPTFLSDGYPLVTTKNLSNGQIDLTEAGLISKDDYEAINKRSRVDRGDILMPMIGTIGNPVLVNIDPVFAIKNVALIKFHDSSPDRHFILHLLRSHYFNSLVAKMQKGGTQKFLALGLIRSLPIPVPPDFIQQKFTSLIKAVEKHSSLLTASCVDFEELLACLQRRAFLGEL